MDRRGVSTFVIAWSQTDIDGLRSAPIGAVEAGVSWRWRGEAVRVDGPQGILVLGDPCEAEAMRRRASHAVRRIVGRALPVRQDLNHIDPDEPIFDQSFILTDGREQFTATLIELAEVSRPLLMFLGNMPPRDRDLWVVQGLEGASIAKRKREEHAGVICFTPGTLLDTPHGPCPVEELTEGMVVSTKDNGPQEIHWIGRRRMSGARLFAMPELRPIRLRADALGIGRPEDDLLVSPNHRLLVRGEVARVLFNTNEVLVAAADLVDDHRILRDHDVRDVTYIHLMFENHEVVWANGLETESFHPAATSLDTIEPEQRARLLGLRPEIGGDPERYGATARRCLRAHEAALLRHPGRGWH